MGCFRGEAFYTASVVNVTVRATATAESPCSVRQSSGSPMQPRSKHRSRRVFVVALLFIAAGVFIVQRARRRELSQRLEQQHPLLLPKVHPGAVIASKPTPRAEAAPAHSAHGIRFPKRIHQTVRNKTQLTCQQRKVIDSWKALNPGYTHQLWDDKDIREFMLQSYPDLVPIPFDEFLSGAERSDLWRVLVLHKLGGVYADMDVQCLKPIDVWNAEHNHDAQVLLGMENYISDREHPIHVTNWVLAATPGHRLLGSMPGIVAKATQHQFFQVMRPDKPVKLSYEVSILDRTGPGALSWAMYDYFKSIGQNMRNVTDKVVSSSDGFIAGGVRVLAVANMALGWEVAEARKKGKQLTCDDVAKKVPDAYVCHMFMGSWRSDWPYKEKASLEECH